MTRPRWHHDGRTRYGREAWSLCVGARQLGGVIRYRWGGDCIGYLSLPSGDRDVARGPTPGPVRQRVRRAARGMETP